MAIDEAAGEEGMRFKETGDKKSKKDKPENECQDCIKLPDKFSFFELNK